MLGVEDFIFTEDEEVKGALDRSFVSTSSFQRLGLLQRDAVDRRPCAGQLRTAFASRIVVFASNFVNQVVVAAAGAGDEGSAPEATS